jgi:hypothetical protein
MRRRVKQPGIWVRRGLDVVVHDGSMMGRLAPPTPGFRGPSSHQRHQVQDLPGRRCSRESTRDGVGDPRAFAAASMRSASVATTDAIPCQPAEAAGCSGAGRMIARDRDRPDPSARFTVDATVAG